MTTTSLRSLGALEVASVKRVQQQIRALDVRLTAMLTKLVAKNPEQSFEELWLKESVQNELRRALELTQQRISQDLKGSYVAASRLAAQTLKKENGITVARDMDPEYLRQLVSDVERYVANAGEDIEKTLRQAYIQAIPARRVAAVRSAMNKSMRRLSVRVRASNSVAVTSAYNDTKLEGYRKHAQYGMEVRKIWRARSANPCPACAALDGTIIDVEASFDPSATTNPEYTLPGVHGGLDAPARHPGCLCELELEVSPFGTKHFQELVMKPPVAYKFINAGTIADMTDTEYKELAGFFANSLKAIRTLKRKAESK